MKNSSLPEPLFFLTDEILLSRISKEMQKLLHDANGAYSIVSNLILMAEEKPSIIKKKKFNLEISCKQLIFLFQEMLALLEQIQEELVSSSCSEQPSLLSKDYIEKLLEETLKLFSDTAGFSWSLSIPEGFKIHCDAKNFWRLVNNIIKNASEALKEKQKKEYDFKGNISIAGLQDLNKNQAILLIEDNGPGISEAISSSLLKERVSTKRKDGGYGLLICHQIMEKIGGKIKIESEKDQGTKVFLYFPSSFF